MWTWPPCPCSGPCHLLFYQDANCPWGEKSCVKNSVNKWLETLFRTLPFLVDTAMQPAVATMAKHMTRSWQIPLFSTNWSLYMYLWPYATAWTAWQKHFARYPMKIPLSIRLFDLNVGQPSIDIRSTSSICTLRENIYLITPWISTSMRSQGVNAHSFPRKRRLVLLQVDLLLSIGKVLLIPSGLQLQVQVWKKLWFKVLTLHASQIWLQALSPVVGAPTCQIGGGHMLAFFFFPGNYRCLGPAWPFLGFYIGVSHSASSSLHALNFDLYYDFVAHPPR